MCTKLRELEEALAVFAGDFDPALMSAGEAEAVMERAARMQHICATLKALAAARVTETDLWRVGGDRTPAHMLGRRFGEPVSKAQHQLETAKRLGAHPKTDAAAREGRLSPEQQAAITEAADADPRCEDDLLDLAARASLQELRDEAARRKAAAVDPEEAHRRIHAGRYARSWTGPDGAWNFSARGTADGGAQFMAALRERADVVFKQARAEDRREPPRPTCSTLSWVWVPEAKRSPPHGAPRCWCGWTSRRCYAVFPPTARCVRSPGSGRCRCRWSRACSPRATPSSPRS
ncbi:MAG: hypothetical protein JO176_04015 [Acidimicrobiia bacterium]|nr:hypothetical protein [Acidimicrobiia bacterium]